MVRSAPTCAALFDASICDRGASSPVLPSLRNFLSCTCPTSRPLLQPSLLTLAAKIFVDLPVHTSCTPPASTAKDSAHTGCVHRYTLPAARLTQSYNVKLAYVAGLDDVLNRICSMSERARHARDARIYRTDGKRYGFRYLTSTRTSPFAWSTMAKAKPHKTFEFESVLLATAGHELRQPRHMI